MARRVIWCFTVLGRSQFPIDMLRYDCCYPANELDSSIIRESFSGEWPVEVRKVELSGHAVPTEGRWASFGWTVSHVVKKTIY